MRAFHVRAYGPSSSHSIESLESPRQPAPNQVLIHTRAVALNAAPGRKIWQFYVVPGPGEPLAAPPPVPVSRVNA